MNTYPEILYKYRTWATDNHKNTLAKNELFFASAKDFNDPFDCRIPYNFSLLDTKPKIKEYLDRVKLTQSELFIQQGWDIEERVADFAHRLTHDIAGVQDEYEKLFFDGLDQYYGILSLSKRWDSTLMWSHYADMHKGFCVGFFEEKMRNTLMVSGGPVKYPTDNIFPDIYPDDLDYINTLKQTYTKSKDWHYEEEFRLTKIFYPSIPTPQNRVVTIPDDFFAEVVIGIEASALIQSEIVEICRIKNIPVFRAVKVPFKFELSRRPI